MAIELRVVQFSSEIILVISNQTPAARSFDFEIMRIISDQIALHSVQLLLLIEKLNQKNILSDLAKSDGNTRMLIATMAYMKCSL